MKNFWIELDKRDPREEMRLDDRAPFETWRIAEGYF